MKYIDADLLRKEIDKRYQEYRAKMKTDDFTYYEGMSDAMDLFEQFIDSLDEQPSEDLEKAVEESWFYYEYRDAQHLYSSCYKDGFKAGAEWQKEQMMKEAVEAEVIELAFSDDGEEVSYTLRGERYPEGFGSHDMKYKVIALPQDKRYDFFKED